MIRCAAVVVFLVCLAACAPTHNVKPLPNFVKVALEPGDRVSVTTHDGTTHDFVITEISGDTLFGDDVQFALHDIATLKKHAWKRPESPCGGEKSLGCSVPFLIDVASESHRHYGKKFYDACAQHDYCYRHGSASYGLDREACDDEFLANMQTSCPGAASSSIGKVFQVFDDSVNSRQTCLSVADDFHAAVRRYGQDKFLTATSTYCEYDGPPTTPGPSRADPSPDPTKE